MLKNGGLALVRKVNIVFCGGGTGGHYYPLMAIKQELDKKLKNKNMYYIGSKYGIESQKIVSENLESLLIPIRGLNRSFNIKNLLNSFLLLFELFFGFVRVFLFFLKNKPSLVIAAKTYLKKSNTIFSGNPLHSKPYKDISLNIDNNKRVLLVLGGSQGSEFLNNLILEGIKKNVIPDIHLIWLVGKNNFSKYEEYNNSSINVLSFVENMPYLYGIADLVVSRSGAMTVSELLQFEKPAIFVPFKFAAENHQYYNAKVLEENFASIIMQEKDITSELLFKKINEIFTNERIYSSMKKNIKAMNKPNSLKIITDNILEYLHVD